MKLPAVFLSFDDNWTDSWKIIFHPEIRVTFFPTDLETLTIGQWKMLRDLGASGHEIGFHGLRHERAGVVFSNKLGVSYIADTIRGMKILVDHGIARPRHFAYPWGNRTPESDAALLKIFDTLRIGGVRIYSGKDLARKRIFAAANWARPHESLVEKAIADKGAIFLYLHRAQSQRLQSLWRYRKFVSFYLPSILGE